MTRYYEHPETGEMVPSVTTILGMLPKPFLTNWAAKVVAERAVKDRSWMVAPTDQEAIDYLKKAIKSDRKAADTGTAVHRAIETGEWEGVPDGYRIAFDAFCEEHRFLTVASEMTVFGDWYAGTLDAILHMGDDLVVVDWKTGRSYPEHFLQLEAYARAAPMTVTKKGLVRLGWDGTYDFEVRDLSGQDLLVFESLGTVFAWQESNERKWEKR